MMDLDLFSLCLHFLNQHAVLILEKIFLCRDYHLLAKHATCFSFSTFGILFFTITLL